MAIAKKLNYEYPWLAWIPVANSFLHPILAGWHWAWWFIFIPALALIPIVFMTALLSPYIIIPALMYGAFIMTMSTIWYWKIFEKRNYPGALALINTASAIPYIGGLAGIGWLIIIGLVAWKDRP